MPPTLTQHLTFLREIDRLKSVVRLTPLLDRSRRENSAEHSWHLALYALVRHSRKRWLYLLAIIGASTLVADGIITPSITVLSAIEGLGALHTAPPVVPISIAIISVLFFIQASV